MQENSEDIEVSNGTAQKRCAIKKVNIEPTHLRSHQKIVHLKMMRLEMA